MDQAELIDKIQEKILNILPAEAIHRLAELEDKGGDYNEEVQKILTENNIDVKNIINQVIEEEKNGEN